MELFIIKKSNDKATQDVHLGSAQPDRCRKFRLFAAEDGDGTMVHDFVGNTGKGFHKIC